MRAMSRNILVPTLGLLLVVFFVSALALHVGEPLLASSVTEDGAIKEHSMIEQSAAVSVDDSAAVDDARRHRRHKRHNRHHKRHNKGHKHHNRHHNKHHNKHIKGRSHTNAAKMLAQKIQNDRKLAHARAQQRQQERQRRRAITKIREKLALKARKAKEKLLMMRMKRRGAKEEEKRNREFRLKMRKLQMQAKKMEKLQKGLKGQVKIAHKYAEEAQIARDQAAKASEHSLAAYKRVHFKPKGSKVTVSLQRLMKKVNENEPNSAHVPKGSPDEWVWEKKALAQARPVFKAANLQVNGLIVDTSADDKQKVKAAYKKAGQQASMVQSAAEKLEAEKKESLIHTAGEKAVEQWSKAEGMKVDDKFRAEEQAYKKQAAEDAKIAANQED